MFDRLVEMMTWSNIGIFLAVVLACAAIGIGVFGYVIRSKFLNFKPMSLDLYQDLDLIPEGYTLETEKITTRDGYILQVSRVRHDASYNQDLKPVVFHHGLGANAACWFVSGEAKSGPLVLAKQGHDVYMTNSRGCFFSLEHETLDTTSKKFWDFSWNELKYDVEATVLHVHEKTNKKMHYISTSNGCGAFLASLSDPDKKWRKTADDIMSKIHIGYLLTPVIFTRNTEAGPCMKDLGKAESIFKKFGAWAVPPDLASKETAKIWNSEEYHKNFHMFPECEKTNEQNDITVYGTARRTFPSGFSITNSKNFYQNYIRDNFGKIDYGKEINMQKYGLETAPEFDLSLARGRINIYHGNRDKLMNSASIHRLARALSNAETKITMNPGFGHVTYVFGINNDEFFGNLLEE